MTAITAAKEIQLEDENVERVEVYAVKTSVAIVQGALVQLTSIQRATNASAVVNRKFAGVALETKTGVVGGTVKIKVRVGGTVALVASTQLTKAYVGCNVAIKDNATVTTASNAGTTLVQCFVGRLKRLDGTVPWVELNNIAQRAV